MKPSTILWPGLAIFIGALSLTGATALVYFAHSDPSFAVEPEYYQRALRWDDEARSTRRSAALGWSARLESSTPIAGGPATLTIQLLDAHGRPVEGAAVQATILANARAADRIRVEPIERAPGRYTAEFAMPHPGSWTVRLIAARGTDEFIQEFQHRPSRRAIAGGSP